MTPRITVKHIQEMTAEHFEIPVEVLKGRRGPRATSEARHVGMFLAREIIGKSYLDIANYYNRSDHTTAFHGCNRVSERMARDPVFAEEINTLRQAIGSIAKDQYTGNARHSYDRLSWCPPEYRSWYSDLRRKCFNHPEARRFIEDQMAADARRAA